MAVSNDRSATTSYTYSLTAPSWTDPSGSYTATLDKFDRQVDLADPVNGSAHWVVTYRADGQPSLVEAPNDNDTTLTYDAAGNVVNKKTAKNNTRRVEYAWTRNRAGNILSEDYTKVTDAVIPAGFAYDGIGRLAAFTRDGATTLYGWQAVPNRDSTQYASDPAVTTTYNDANRPLTDSAGGTYDSNDEGQLELRPGQDLDWDGLGRLTAVWNATHTTRLAAYTYDALDRLLIVDRGATDQLRFRYVGVTTQVAQIVDHDASTVIRSIANDWSGERLLDWTGSGANLRYYGTNSHRDTSWTASSTGAVDATLRYDPWGNLSSSTGSSLPDFRFQGAWFDSITTLSWVVARWYAPTLARFVSEDPLLGQLAIPGSRHLYVYGNANPLLNIDPDGRATICLGGRYQNACSQRESWSISNRAKRTGRMFISVFIKLSHVCLDPFCLAWFDGDGRVFRSWGDRVNSRVYLSIDFDRRSVVVQVNPSCGHIPLGDYACHHAREIQRENPAFTLGNAASVTEKYDGTLDVQWSVRDSAALWTPATRGWVTIKAPQSGSNIVIRRHSYPSMEMYYYNWIYPLYYGPRKVFTRSEGEVFTMFNPWLDENWNCTWPVSSSTCLRFP